VTLKRDAQSRRTGVKKRGGEQRGGGEEGGLLLPLRRTWHQKPAQRGPKEQLQRAVRAHLEGSGAGALILLYERVRKREGGRGQVANR